MFNFLENKALTVWEDCLPTVVKYNGETVRQLSAYLRNVKGTNSVSYNSEYKQNLFKMQIDGNTVQDGTPTPEIPIPIQNAGDNGIECVLRGKNLLDVDKFVGLVKKYDPNWGASVNVDGRRCVRFGTHMLYGKDFTSCCPVFKENTRYIFSFEAKPNTIVPEDSQYGGEISIGFKPSGVATGARLNGKTTTEFTRIYAVNKSNTTVTDINISYSSAHVWLIDLDTIYLYEYEGNDNPKYEPYFHKTLSLPSSVTVDGQEVQLNMGGLSSSTTNYRSHILVDRVRNKVFYYEYQKLATTNQAYSRLRILQDVVWFQAGYLGVPNWQARPSLCTHFQRKYSTTYNVVGFAQGGYDSIIYISLPLTMFADPTNPTKEEATAWLQSEADKGTPVTFLTTYAEPIEYDLTETELGQQILDFVNSTQNATNIIEIQSMPSVSQLSVNYAKWGGALDEI